VAGDDPYEGTGEFDTSALLDRIGAWAAERAEDALDTSVETLEAMWVQQTIERVLSSDGHELLGVLAGSGVLDGPGADEPNAWLAFADIRAMVTGQLGWPDNPEGDRRISATLTEAGVESKRRTRAKIVSYLINDLRAAIKRHSTS
jgi:hypothetical protein